MNTPPDYYALLGVSPNASTDDIKKAYRSLIGKHHPDRSVTADEQIFLINEAYETLKDPEKRKNYDRIYTFYVQSPSGVPWQSFSEQLGKLFKTAKQQLHEQGAKGASRILHELGDQFAPNTPTLIIDLDMAYYGGKHQFTYQGQTIKTTLPKGLYPNAKIKLNLQGRGVWFVIDIDTPKDITIHGKDIHRTVSVYPWQVALGERLTLTHQGETLNITLPENHDLQTPYYVPNKGIPPHDVGGLAGSLYLHLVMVLPKSPLTDKQRDAWRALKTISTLK